MPVSLTSKQQTALERELDQGRKLQGIKLVREYFGLSQDEAVDLVEHFALEKANRCRNPASLRSFSSARHDLMWLFRAAGAVDIKDAEPKDTP